MGTVESESLDVEEWIIFGYKSKELNKKYRLWKYGYAAIENLTTKRTHNIKPIRSTKEIRGESLLLFMKLLENISNTKSHFTMYIHGSP